MKGRSAIDLDHFAQQIINFLDSGLINEEIRGAPSVVKPQNIVF